MEETWVSPVTRGVEASSDRGAVWRFRLLGLAVLLLIVAGAALAIYRLQGNGGGT